MTHKIKLTLIKSLNKRIKKHVSCIRGLGLKKINSFVELEPDPSIMGMVNKVAYLLKIEEIKS